MCNNDIIIIIEFRCNHTLSILHTCLLSSATVLISIILLYLRRNMWISLSYTHAHATTNYSQPILASPHYTVSAMWLGCR